MATDYSMCFAFGISECLALNRKICEQGKPCPFFKTKKQLEEEQEKTSKRLVKLELVQAVKDKYYYK